MTRASLALLALLALPVALAQTAPGPGRAVPPAALDRYHEAARLFIEGETDAAARAADAGLALAPGHRKLQELRDLIRQQESQDPQSGGDEQQPDESQDPQSGEGEPDDADQGGQNGRSPERPDDDQTADRDQTDAQPQDAPDPPPADASGQRPGQGEATPSGQPGPVPEGRMTRDQANRILDAVGGDERLLLREMRRAPSRVRQSDKDW